MSPLVCCCTDCTPLFLTRISVILLFILSFIVLSHVMFLPFLLLSRVIIIVHCCPCFDNVGKKTTQDFVSTPAQPGCQ